MGKKHLSASFDGHIDTRRIYDTHRRIKKIVESFREVNKEVAAITRTIEQNWVGEGRDEFEAQYGLLISKIEDFGDTLQDMYDALVEAEASYEGTDDKIRQEFAMQQQ